MRAAAEVDSAGRVSSNPSTCRVSSRGLLAVRRHGCAWRGEELGRSGTSQSSRRWRCSKGPYAARLIQGRALRGKDYKPFHYREQGQTLATIGRARCRRDLTRFASVGSPHWVTWLVVHLWYLIGFQTGLIVLIPLVVQLLPRDAAARDRARAGHCGGRPTSL